jgi:coproporphyrinogen III oxidase
MTDWTNHTAQARTWFESLRDRICAEFEAIEREAGSDASFAYTPRGTAKPMVRLSRTAAAGAQGLMKGKVFEKGRRQRLHRTGRISRRNLPVSINGASAETARLSPRLASALWRTWPIRMSLRST